MYTAFFATYIIMLIIIEKVFSKNGYGPTFGHHI